MKNVSLNGFYDWALTMRMIIKLALFGTLVFSHTVQSDETASNVSYSGDLFSRTKLTGDWGIRDDMAEHGVTLD